MFHRDKRWIGSLKLLKANLPFFRLHVFTIYIYVSSGFRNIVLFQYFSERRRQYTKALFIARGGVSVGLKNVYFDHTRSPFLLIKIRYK